MPAKMSAPRSMSVEALVPFLTDAFYGDVHDPESWPRFEGVATAVRALVEAKVREALKLAAEPRDLVKTVLGCTGSGALLETSRRITNEEIVARVMEGA